MSNSKLIKDNPVNLKILQQQNILLVEDDLLNAKLVSILFLQNRLTLQHVENGISAIEKLKTNEYDIILMDMEMPVMNGYQATTIIRQQLKRNTPIIALTAHVLPGEKEKCLKYGMNDYLTKPIDPNLLFESIFNLVSGKKYIVANSIAPKNETKRVLPQQICNLAYLIETTGGNKKMINNIVAVFFKETKKELCFLRDAIQKSNYPAINEVSHKIKSAFSILGITLLENVFKEMEKLSSLSAPIEKIKLLNNTVNIVFNQARAEMKAMD